MELKRSRTEKEFSTFDHFNNDKFCSYEAQVCYKRAMKVNKGFIQ